MTTIAVRAGVMACDSAWTATNDSVLTLQTKIVRTKHNVLIAGAGDCSDRDLMTMLSQVRTPNDFPSLKDLLNTVQPGSDLATLIYFPDRQIWLIEKTEDKIIELFRIDAPYAAIGSGSKHAITAMDLDCSAAKAVELACRRDPPSRLPVHAMGFLAARKKKRRR